MVLVARTDERGVNQYLRLSQGRLLALLLASNVLPVAIAMAAGVASHREVFYDGALGACGAAVLLALIPARRRAIRSLIGLACLPLLTLMQAHSGGVDSNYALLLVVVVVWFGLLCEARDLLAMPLLLAGCCFGPMLVIGGPAYPVHWEHAAILALVCLTLTGTLRAAVRESQRLAERLERGSMLDGVTGLLTRRGWELVGRPTLERAERSRSALTLALIELDRTPNGDQHARHERDRMLRHVAEEMRSTLRGGDVLARVAEDRFATLLADTGPEGAEVALARLRAAIGPVVSFSAGVAVLYGAEGLEVLTERAEEALGIAMGTGIDRTRFALRPLRVATA
jgi:diguanylate cyclase (GGDEF)-like protein